MMSSNVLHSYAAVQHQNHLAAARNAMAEEIDVMAADGQDITSSGC
jgi:hypothetical protein